MAGDDARLPQEILGLSLSPPASCRYRTSELAGLELSKHNSELVLARGQGIAKLRLATAPH